MGLIEEILVRPRLRQKLWAWWYPFFTRRVRAQGIDFLNYAFESEDATALPLTNRTAPISSSMSTSAETSP
jgi:hypothetical protein